MRKWLPHFAELVDRLSIHQLKEIFISEHKEKYRSEMGDILHDLGKIIEEKDIKITPHLIHCIVALSQMNAHIWYNESAARKGEDQSPEKLRLSHSLNGVRNSLMNIILNLINDKNRSDYKIDCLASEFKNQWQIGIIEDANK